jgi:hypothetical protein
MIEHYIWDLVSQMNMRGWYDKGKTQRLAWCSCEMQWLTKTWWKPLTPHSLIFFNSILNLSVIRKVCSSILTWAFYAPKKVLWPAMSHDSTTSMAQLHRASQHNTLNNSTMKTDPQGERLAAAQSDMPKNEHAWGRRGYEYLQSVRPFLSFVNTLSPFRGGQSQCHMLASNIQIVHGLFPTVLPFHEYLDLEERVHIRLRH